MATTLKTQSQTGAAPLGSADIARAIITPLASLKLTVFLLILAVAVVFIATLDQTRADVYDVKMKHFENAFVAVPFQTFFVPRWFPDMQNVPGTFYIPSGFTILILMLANLAAAHILRFKLQAKGGKLLVGIVAAIVAGLVTWAVIFNGHSADGTQTKPPIPYTQMWMLMQAGLFGLAVASAIGFFTLSKDRTAERIVLGSAALAGGLVLGLTVYLGQKGYIGDSAMRILFQLSQATIAALVSYAACLLLFRRKAGIVLLHLGVAGLMANEIYVTMTNDEQRITIIEGETASHAIDVRATEMAFFDVSDPEFDHITAIAGSRLVGQQDVTDEKLPVDVRCVEYFPNSDIRRVTSPKKNLATTGVGTAFEAYKLPSTAGTDSEQTVDFASAYVELKSKTDGKVLGTHLISQHISERRSDSIQVDGKEYRLGLRFKTQYKPYSLKLNDAERTNYIGTQTPKSYSSEVTLTDFRTDVSSDQKIWMNNPLRYSGETFYQSGMNKLDDGRELTILQVVTNHGWMVPYVCCMFTVVGLIAQFGSTLLGFLEATRKRELREFELTMRKFEVNAENTEGKDPPTGLNADLTKAETSVPVAELAYTPPKPSWAVAWLPTAILVGIMGIWVAGELFKSGTGSVVRDEMRLDLLGQVPIAMNGRVQPLDSFARNTVRQLNKREYVLDANEEKQPAIRWLADTVFEADGYLDYRLFRIEDLNILNALELPAAFPGKRGTFRYTFGELLDAEPALRELIPDRDEKDPKSWSQFQKRLYSVAQKMQQVYGAKMAFGAADSGDEDLMFRLERAGKMVSSPLIPLIVPVDDEEKPWESFIEMQNRVWLSELAERFESDSTQSLAQALIEKEVLPGLREDTIRQRIFERIVTDPDFIELMKQQDSQADPRVLAERMLQNWDAMPASLKDPLVATEGPLVDAMISPQIPKFVSVMEGQLAVINGSSGEISNENSELTGLLSTLRSDYLEGNAEGFNSSLETYLANVNQNPPSGMKPIRMKTEGFYNWFSPFFVAMIVYLVAFFASTFAWIGWRKSWNRAAFFLISLALAIHFFGLISRIVISGRPPVTNLYSSALFVSAAMVVLMLLVELFTKIGMGNLMASLGAFLALMWAWSMTIIDGDTFTVMVAVLDTQFWLATHVVIISIGYAATFGAGLLGAAFLLGSLFSPLVKNTRGKIIVGTCGSICIGLMGGVLKTQFWLNQDPVICAFGYVGTFVLGLLGTALQLSALLGPSLKVKTTRRQVSNVIYGVVCFGLLCSFFGTVLGGLWGDDSWGRFWGWDPKENGALMIVLWNAVVLHARWGGVVRERGLAALAVLGNVVVLWSWKGVNAMGVGLHAYAATEDDTVMKMLYLAIAHIVVACLVVIPAGLWMSQPKDEVANLKG